MDLNGKFMIDFEYVNNVMNTWEHQDYEKYCIKQSEIKLKNYLMIVDKEHPTILAFTAYKLLNYIEFDELLNFIFIQTNNNQIEFINDTKTEICKDLLSKIMHEYLNMYTEYLKEINNDYTVMEKLKKYYTGIDSLQENLDAIQHNEYWFNDFDNVCQTIIQESNEEFIDYYHILNTIHCSFISDAEFDKLDLDINNLEYSDLSEEEQEKEYDRLYEKLERRNKYKIKVIDQLFIQLHENLFSRFDLKEKLE